MKLKYKFIFGFFLSFFVIANTTCQKKLIGSVKVEGRIVNTKTQLGEAVELDLMADNRFSGRTSSMGTIFIASVTSNSDGTFFLKGKASKTNIYYIRVKGGLFAKVNDADNFTAGIFGVKDVGTVFASF